MLRNGQKILFILQFFFIISITEISTQNVELSLEIDTEAEQQIIGNENEHKEDDNANGLLPEEIVSEVHINPEEGEQENQLKYGETPPFKFKNIAYKQDESGFDLTREEITKFKIWKDGIIPYYIDVVSFSDNAFRDKIRNYLQTVNSRTSLNFVELAQPPTDDSDRWVFFMNRRGLLKCADHTVQNFTNQGVQQVVLGYDCMVTKGELAEAVMSIAGVPAQHNAPDRDKYIKVNMENIMPDKTYLFEKLRDNDWLFHDLEYDFKSITHYDMHKYSANGRVTIELKKQSEDFNPAVELSATDILKIKMLYNYITRNKKLQIPVCRKLFKPSSKFNRPNPANKHSKARKKPDKYTGTADDGGHEDEFVAKQKENKGYQYNKHSGDGDGQNEKKNGDDAHNEDVNRKEEDSGPNEDEDGHNEDGDEHNADGIGYNEDANVDKSKSITEKDSLNVKKTKEEDPLVFLSDYESTERAKLNLIRPAKTDLFGYLSDYQTSDERDRKRKLQHIKKKTLNYSNGKQALKFTSVGTSLYKYKQRNGKK